MADNGYIEKDDIQQRALSLLELNGRIKNVINDSFSGTCWLRAEMSDVRTNVSSGHCYLEFIEKDSVSGQLVARARATIWAKTFRMIKPYFESQTGQLFASGLKVLVQVSVEFHKLYGFSLTVLDIDPAYTLGDMVRKRMEIIHRLKEEGVFSLNKELPFPTLPQRIAVITSPTAAGYEDFLNQILGNDRGYVFYTKLFPAIMQGEKTEESVISALESVYAYMDDFDVVVIIRGGGATSDLNSFDSYLLAANCAQFPLPIITGIGHERDDTVVDMVAHTRVKTPTAAAEFLVACMDETSEELSDIQQEICSMVSDILQKRKADLQLLGSRLPAVVTNKIEKNRSLLASVSARFPVMASSFLKLQASQLESLQVLLKEKTFVCLDSYSRFLQMEEQFVRMASPEYILKRGYSLTLRNGQIIKEAKVLLEGDKVVTRFADGDVSSSVESVSLKQK
jgi:exodeoxyribonuclease VII large subunit